MEIVLDDQPLVVDDGPATLADVVARGKQEAARRDRVIASIVYDGTDLAHDELAARLAAPVDDTTRVELRTCTPGDLVADALTQALALLDQTDRRREQVVEWLAQGDTRRANGGLIECFQNWSRIHTALVQAIAMLRLDAGALEVNGEPIVSLLGAITHQLQQVKNVLLSGDQVLLADLLQYEFGEATTRWKAAIETILAPTRAG